MVADLFFREALPVNKIAERLGISRERVYPLIIEARERGFVRLVPPQDEILENHLRSEFRLETGRVSVVETGRSDVPENPFKPQGEHVATRAAEIALELIRKVATARQTVTRYRPKHARGPAPARKEEPQAATLTAEIEPKPVVTLGLGPGRATLEFSKQLSLLLRSAPHVPLLRLVAISSGCPADSPQYASTSFFNLFPPEVVAGSIGLFSETLVTQEEFEKLRQEGRLGVKEAFDVKDEIDIVITSMGSAVDEHDLLRTLVSRAGGGKPFRSIGPGSGWVGNVQFRPYSAAGPIVQAPAELRAVTLFELSDFATWAHRNDKQVILMARTCALCGMTRAAALRPLLKNEKLRVWSELVTDVRTARELLAGTG
jgi:DNA-binding transcriptional regulator LsrR (DeoR family)